jgi:hypothetical protein
MGVGEQLTNLYLQLEDKYYKFAEWLEAHKIPFIKYFVEPIEKNGIPSFPIAVLLLFVILLGVAAALGAFAPGTTTVRVQLSAEGRPVSDVPVTLLVAGERAARNATAQNGVATFANVPVGAQATVSVRDPSYANFSRTFEVKRDHVLRATLEAPPAAARVLVTLRVKDERGSGLPDTRISFSDPATGEFREFVTDGSGIARVEVTDVQQFYSISVTREGFQPRQHTLSPSIRLAEEITLTPAREVDLADGGDREPEGTVVVVVKDSDGNRVEGARVSLFDAGAYTSIDVASTNREGVVTFGRITAGKRVYVNAEPSEERARELNPYYGVEDAQHVSERGDTEFRVELVKKSPAEVNTLAVKILDESGRALEGATVRLLAMGASAALGTPQQSGSDGSTTFTLSPGVSAYAVAWKQGYLPGRALNLKAGDAPQIQLAQAIVGSYADAEITVRDADGELVPAARVRLEYSDGFDVGMPEQTTGADGIALFAQLPVGSPIRAVAAHGSLKGYSDTFSLSFSEVGDAAHAAEVMLEPSLGDLLAIAVDVTTGQAVPAASFTAVSGNQVLANCTAPAGANTCALRVRAGREVVVKASASGYAASESAPVLVAAEQRREVRVSVLPADLANQLRIELTSVYPASQLVGLGSAVRDQLERGTPYIAEFFYNIPASEKAGVFLRFGDGASAGDDVVGADDDQPNAPSGFDAFRFSTYNPATGCLAESTEAMGDAYKTVSFETRNRTQASGSAAVVFFVKPGAAPGTKVPIYYRAWAARGGAYSRVPADAVLGTSRSTASRQECYAESRSKSYTVIEGGSACNEKACISLTFQDLNDPTRKGSRGFEATFNSAFKATADVRAFVAVDPGSAYVKISNDRDRSIRFGQGYEARATIPGIPPSPPAQAFAEFQALPVLPTPYTRLFVEFGDSRGVLVQDEYQVSVQGTVTPVVSIEPQLLQGGVEQDVTVRVTTPQGTPVTRARIELLEGKGVPFNGEPPASLEGDGSEGLGENGIYVFRKLQPVAPGEVQVRVTVPNPAPSASLQGAVSVTYFRTVIIVVQVAMFDFLEFAPESASLSGSACNASTEVTLVNPLQSDVVVRYAFVGASPCVDVFSAGAWRPGASRTIKKSTASKQGALKLQLRPAAQRRRAQEACTLSFSYWVAGQAGYVTSDVIVPAEVDCPVALPPAEFRKLPPGVRPCVEDQDEACGGNYAPDGVCERNACSCLPDPVTGVVPPSCDPQQNFQLIQQCGVQVSGSGYGYPISPASGTPASCISGRCEVGLCDCGPALENKYTELAFNHLWFNYLLSRITEPTIKFTDARGGFVGKFGPDGSLASFVAKPPSTINRQQAGDGALFTEQWQPGQGDTPPATTPSSTPCSGADLCFTVSELAGEAALALVLDNSQSQNPSCDLAYSFEQRDWEVVEVPEGHADLGVFRSLDFLSIPSFVATRVFGVERDFEAGRIATKISARASEAYFLRFIGAPGGAFPTGAPERVYTFNFGCAGRGQAFSKKVKVTAKAVPAKYAVPVVPGAGSNLVMRTEGATFPQFVSVANNILSPGANVTVKIGSQPVIVAQPGRVPVVTPVPLAEAAGSNKLEIRVAGAPRPINPATDELKVDRSKRLPEGLRASLGKYDVDGNVINGNTYEACSKGDYCVSSEGWRNTVVQEIQQSLRGSMVTGAKSSVRRDTPAGNTFLDAFFVALYDTAQAACADGEFLECVMKVPVSQRAGQQPGGFPGGYPGGYPGGFPGGYPGGPGGYPGGPGGYQGYYPNYGYGQSYYGGIGAPGFPGFTGQYNPQCNFQVALNKICSKFFSPTARYRSSDRASRIGHIGVESLGTVACSVAILQAIGAVGPGRRPIYTPTFGAWGQPAAFGQDFFLANAANQARQRLFGNPAFTEEWIPYGTPETPNDEPLKLYIPWRKAGRASASEAYGEAYERIDITHNDVQRSTTTSQSGIYRGSAGAAEACGTLVGGLCRGLGLDSLGQTSDAYFNTQAQTFRTQADQAEGYPYLDCATGSCKAARAKFDQPVLATMNKYKVEGMPGVRVNDALGVLPKWNSLMPAMDSIPGESLKLLSRSRAYACAKLSVSTARDAIQEPAGNQYRKKSRVSATDGVYKCYATNSLGSGESEFTVAPKDYPSTALEEGVIVREGYPISGSKVLDSNAFFVLAIGQNEDSPHLVLPRTSEADVQKIVILDNAVAKLREAIRTGGGSASTGTGGSTIRDLFRTAPATTGTSGGPDSVTAVQSDLALFCKAFNSVLYDPAASADGFLVKAESAANEVLAAGSLEVTESLRLIRSAGQAIFSTKDRLFKGNDCLSSSTDPRATTNIGEVANAFANAHADIATAARQVVLARAKSKIDGNWDDARYSSKYRTSLEALGSSMGEINRAFTASAHAKPRALAPAVTAVGTRSVINVDVDANKADVEKRLSLVYYGQAHVHLRLGTRDGKSQQELIVTAKPLIRVPRVKESSAGGPVEMPEGKAWSFSDSGKSAWGMVTYFIKEDDGAQGLVDFIDQEFCKTSTGTRLAYLGNEGKKLALWCSRKLSPFRPEGTEDYALTSQVLEESTEEYTGELERAAGTSPTP